MAELRAGTIVDRYVVEGMLGRGGMATVYKVRHKDLDSIHALKVLTVHSDSIRERLRQEGKAQARMRHPNIVSVTDLVDVQGAPGLIMECVEGPDLSQIMDLVQSDQELADRVARGVISGVLEAHRLGMVHRVLKPANILIAQQGDHLVPKVTDFGLVKVLITDEDAAHRTQAGSTMGTPAYMAPEQIRDPRLVDARADLFSLGVILYELVCGVKPFESPDMLVLFTAISSGEYTPPREHKPDLPERMERAILGCLEVQREQRIPDCRVLYEIWEGRMVDWRAEALEREEQKDPSWNTVLRAAWNQEGELSNSMTAVPSSIEPGMAPPSEAPSQPPAPEGHHQETFYADAPPEGDPADPSFTYYEPPPPDSKIPDEAVIPESPQPTAVPPTVEPELEPSVETPPRTRGPLPWILGAVALAGAVAIGVTMLPDGDDPAPIEPTPPPVVEPVEPDPVEPEPVEPEPAAPELDPEDAVADVEAPAPEDAPGSAEPEPVEPRSQPATSPTPSGTGSAATAAPDPAPTEPEPEPVVPEPVEVTPEPVAAPTTATVTVDGGLRVWLVGAAGRFPPGDVPPGSYTIKAFFDPMEPIDAGSFEAKAGDNLIVSCSAAMARCTARAR